VGGRNPAAQTRGAALTAFELAAHGVPHTVIADNLGGHLMQQGRVDMVIVGSDRITATGDVCNKVGTYLKALAARDNGVPFYARVFRSAPSTGLWDQARDIPIEERSPTELTHVTGPNLLRLDRDRESGAGGEPGPQPGVRRDARETGDRIDYRVRSVLREPCRVCKNLYPNR